MRPSRKSCASSGKDFSSNCDGKAVFSALAETAVLSAAFEAGLQAVNAAHKASSPAVKPSDVIAGRLIDFFIAPLMGLSTVPQGLWLFLRL